MDLSTESDRPQPRSLATIHGADLSDTQIVDNLPSTVVNKILEKLPANLTLRAEFATTIFAGLIGGICFSLFNMQPASATGAMLQEAIHFVHTSDPGESAFDLGHRQEQLLTLFRFTVMLCALGAGTGWGRMGRIALWDYPSPRLRLLGRSVVPLMSALALVVLTWALHTNDRHLDNLQRTYICSMFAFSTGLLWGIMPADNMTTARSFLVKRAALGDLWAVRQIVLFLFCVGFAGSLYQFINISHPSMHIIGSLVVLFGLMDTSYLASSVFLESPLPPESDKQLKPWAPAISTTLAILFGIIAVSYGATLDSNHRPSARATISAPATHETAIP
ncbi:MAG TPA: hypothetical protein VM510_02315 [Caulifigura sp.]|nr:hypothetical protein [Caulifigura sp.]